MLKIEHGKPYPFLVEFPRSSDDKRKEMLVYCQDNFPLNQDLFVGYLHTETLVNPNGIFCTILIVGDFSQNLMLYCFTWCMVRISESSIILEKIGS